MDVAEDDGGGRGVLDGDADRLVEGELLSVGAARFGAGDEFSEDVTAFLNIAYSWATSQSVELSLVCSA